VDDKNLLGGAISPFLKNDGVRKVNGFRMTSFFYEMENNPVMFETTNQTTNGIKLPLRITINDVY